MEKESLKTQTIYLNNFIPYIALSINKNKIKFLRIKGANDNMKNTS